LQQGQHSGDGLDEVAAPVAGQQLGDDLGVGVAVEGDAVGFELAFEGGGVLDDAVVDDGDDAVAAHLPGGGGGGGRAVRRPARVADAQAPGGGAVAQVADQVGDAAGPLADVQLAAGQGGDAGGVVAAVLQPAQALDEKGFRLVTADVPNDAAHAHS